MFDFKQIVEKISAGALEIHDPAIKKLESGNPEFKAPGFFGDRQGKYTVGMVFHHEIQLSQEWIESNYQSINRAIKILCPQDVFNQYAEQYISSPYYDEGPLKTMLIAIESKLGCPVSKKIAESFGINQKKMYSGITDDRRRVDDRKLFTYAELEFTKNLYAVFPELIQSLVAYQSIFVAYFEDLRSNIEQKIKSDGFNQNLHDAVVAITNLTQFGDVANAMGSIVPAIGLMYAKNHYLYPEDIEKLKIDPHCPPNIQDICEGIEFAFKNGTFTHKVGERVSTCPARNAIISYSSTRLDILEPAEALESMQHKSNADKTVWPEDIDYSLDDSAFKGRLGSMIYSIYKIIHFNPIDKEKLKTLATPTKQDVKPQSEESRCPFLKQNQS